MKRINAARIGETVIEFELDGSETLLLGKGYLDYKPIGTGNNALLMWLPEGEETPMHLSCANKGGNWREAGYCNRRDLGQALRSIARLGGFKI